MAVDLDINQLPHVVNTTLGLADVVTEHELPPEARKVSIRFRTNAGKLVTLQTVVDGGTLTTEAYATIDADIWHEVSIIQGEAGSATRIGSIFLASATGSTVVEVVVEG